MNLRQGVAPAVLTLPNSISLCWPLGVSTSCQVPPTRATDVIECQKVNRGCEIGVQSIPSDLFLAMTHSAKLSLTTKAVAVFGTVWPGGQTVPRGSRLPQPGPSETNILRLFG